MDAVSSDETPYLDDRCAAPVLPTKSRYRSYSAICAPCPSATSRHGHPRCSGVGINVTGFYWPIIARVMGTAPEKIWPAASRRARPVRYRASLKDRRDRTAGAVAGLRKKLDDLRRQAQVIRQLEDSISTLEAELRDLDAMLAVPVPGELPKRQAR
jgi:hypothetical protein